jgi:very-short-patch-repair endonuclease
MRALRVKDQRVPRARRLRRDVTDAERKLWQRLRALETDGSHFRRQATIGPYFADFACHARKLVIELDGGQHGVEAHSVADSKRDAYMRANGYRVLRFWNNDVMQDADGVLEVIAEALSVSPPPTPDPSPPLRGGRGNPRRRQRLTTNA